MFNFEKFCYVTLTVSAVVMASVSVVTRFGPPSPLVGGVGPGDKAPDLSVHLSSGGQEDAFGPEGETLLVFFSTVCKFCNQSMPTYQEIARDRCDLKVTFVVLDQRDEALELWWSQNGWSRDDACAKVVLGSPAESVAPFGVRGTPTMVLVDRDGTVRRTHEGVLLEVPQWLER